MGRLRLVALCAAAVLLAAGCNPQGSEGEEGDEPTVAASAPEDKPSTSGEGQAVTTLEDVEDATIQIVAQGSFVDPEVGLRLNAAGNGSGFLIDPTGIAVTNNHVVTGAATLEVYVSGQDDPVNARVLGVSECSDLAVIDLDGEGYPFLEFREGEVDTGLDVYAAGFPDPEFTLTRGIVSKAEAPGETSWASVDGVIEHDARINPGSSGGPLVDPDGRVVAVNYAESFPEGGVPQQYAIAAQPAREIIDQLSAGENVESIGVNGVALNVEEENISGIWVSSVATGSPADETRIQPGDIITRMEGLVLATDGTMREYCDILRSRNPEDPIAVEVLRFETSEFLEGQLNGRELEQSFSFAQELEGSANTGGAPAATYGSYVTITDDTGALSVEVPAEWSDVDGRPYQANGINLVDVRASSNLQAFQGGWDTPGMIFTASSQLAQTSNEIAFLDELVESGSQQCTYEGRQPYEDAAYTGSYDLYTNCGGVGATYVVVGAVPPDRAFVIRVQVQANDDRDFEALDHILRSFVVTGQV